MRRKKIASTIALFAILGLSTFTMVGVTAQNSDQVDTGKDLRKAFAYCFDWETYIDAAFMGEAKQPPNPEVEGLAYDDYLWDVGDPDLDPPDTILSEPYDQPLLPDGSGPLPPNRYYYYNLTKAEEYFRTAWSGEVWEKGFTFTILYNTGNTARKIAAERIEENVESINPKFHIEVKEVDWPTYLTAMVSGDLPMFIIGWLADYPDPHNWFQPFMHSDGAFSAWQNYNNSHVDELIEQGITETDDNKRIEIYHELGEIYFEDAPGFIIAQATGRHWERPAAKGWYYNPIYPGPYWYHLWKEPAEDTMVYDTLWGPATVDPAWSYDTSSATLIQNVYDTLIRFKVDRSMEDVTQQGLTDEFEMNLATEIVEAASPHPDAPEYTDNTWYFKIRTDVPWHDSTYGTVTPADVEYSFERWMVFSRDGGPQWMIYDPLLGPGSAADWSDPEMPTKIDNAVESNSTHVWFNLATPYPPLVFKQIIAQGWASIIPNEWAYEHNCWPGEAHPEENPYTNETMTQYYNPDVSPLDDYPPETGGRVECGSGPYMLSDFDSTAQRYTLSRFSDYWHGWPAPDCDDYVETIILKGIDEWSTRKAEFLAGDCDFCYVPRENLPEMVVNWPETPEEYPEGITCYKDLPTLQNTAFFYTFDITTEGNQYIGSGDPNTIQEEGIPSWFFTDTRPASAPEPGDLDGDGISDYLDPDIDGDGVPNEDDPKPYDPDVTGKGWPLWMIIVIIVVIIAIIAIAALVLMRRK